MSVVVAACDAGHSSSAHSASSATRGSDSRGGAARSSLEYGSEEDVAKILRANGVAPPALACTNVSYASDPAHGAIRTVSCTLPLDAAGVDTLVKRIPLKAGEAFHAPPDYARSCGTKMPKDAAVEVLVGENSSVPNGVGRIEVHVVRGQPTACIEITYPWSE